MSTKNTKKKNSTILKIGSNFTIDNSNLILSQYKEALDKGRSVKLKSDIIENIDLTGIQLLFSILKDNKSEQKPEFELSFSESSTELIKKCGFSQLLNA